MKRFSETDKWKDPWFRKLRPPEKLLFLFIVDACNNAGFWEEDIEHACYCTGMTSEQYQGAIKGLTRGLVGASGWHWVRTFLKHQKNEKLNPDNKAHTQIIRLIAEQEERFSESEEFRGFLAPYKPLVRGLGRGIGIGIGKGKGVEGGDEQEDEPEKKTKRRGTREEFEAYAVERGFPVTDGSAMFDHFESNGWKRGQNPIKDWRAAFRTWEQNGWLASQNGPNGRKPQAATPPLKFV